MSQPIILESSLSWSGALRRKLMADESFALWLSKAGGEPVTRRVIQDWFAELGGGGTLPVTNLRHVLRLLRARVFYTLMVRDINGEAPLHEVVGAMSALADLAVAEAYKSVVTSLVEVHGVPRDPHTGLPQEMLIVGMGKLGGRELNVSSDIDLIMLYGEEGETDGRRKISHHEFYGKVTQRMMPVLSEPDADGQVFRSDLRLRPDGDSGPLAWSLDALENYLVVQGREWERYAWLKGRVIPCKAFADSETAAQREQLERLRRPFVYRKYFDFDALASLRGLRERIRQDWERRASARNGIDSIHNIKLGEGGIREIEFVVQLSQLIRGGRAPSLQQRTLLTALHKQNKAGVIAPEVAESLGAAYIFLRRVEHMLQYREDEQTHLLPRDPSLCEGLAAVMGMSREEFDQTLADHRAFVSRTFRDAFRIAGMGDGEDNDPPQRLPEAPCADLADHIRQVLGEDTPQASDLCRRVDSLLESHRIRSLSASSRKRLDALLPAIMSASASTEQPAITASRLLELVEQVAQRSAYLALLAEYPETLARVARLVSASPWASQYLRRHPILLDSLIEWRTLMAPPDFEQIGAQLRSELDACVLADGQADMEQQMNLMRDTQHQVSFQLLAQDLEGELTVEQLADRLSALADMLLAETISRVWPLVQPRGQRDNVAPPRFAIIAYGKLGGKEIGYASDLDLVFLYEDPNTEASERYAKLGRRMVSWLSTMTSSGRLYEIDLRLRPDGDAGLLAVSLEAFEQYQLNHAWVWEHQAITRARFVAGDAQIGQRFEQIRRQVLLAPREAGKLKEEVRAMRERISAGHPNRSTDFDLKHDRGGMVDVEFVTQYLVLLHAHEHAALLENLGNITLLGIAAKTGLIPADLAEKAANAYRVFRKRQHALRLQGAQKARIPDDQLVEERNAVMQLWDKVIGD
ncbi:bifunctional [glutamate--ammonia ligase]-adenylyl-L-tyrosine phosphorylase/[glutamate--ammonia-ligase] adenylyltransferase [Allopusillimonas soli]|uniref:Bifunctional glutamine synthetase adenylyltransferase/adenylyl-removing enzyme n=1 Tax=Allopusillimonas soli TaxID=659016 RepID=A0A853F9G6_9BURK|nr:bifunctional [glutamate--ammonia ligase]-adenylyl-L-tyrosine phosphorylase/[glutamate--ammonia-ligase] adenylyltransferase [Allopusillimonas soli]NYT35251.1 bifunctional [glutamate--ammonia ligase]-adenylyl-L-tyrosine phosphorylase/[glutamate--ammonia-ligase] adenylyltransferase [Allopusillimonas soli]TEA75678.1 bifunctional [glutamate--ammonia ligase]-adenylyl-L-tyrosine phosphorylase/[glutamate--ammonia-ligase] adenylyltransferase [Allopusillimonas soli]